MLVFCHCPKAGGTSIKQNLRSYFTSEKTFAFYSRGELKKKFLTQDLGDFTFVCGHFSIKEALMNPSIQSMHQNGNVDFIGCVRDPIDRIISSYNYEYFYKDHPRHHSTRKMTLNDYVHTQPPNKQSKFYSFDDTSEIKEILLKVSIIPIDTLAASLSRYMSNFPNFKINGKLAHSNKSSDLLSANEEIFSRKDIDGQCLASLTKKHRKDIRLHKLSLDQFKI